MEPVNGLSFLSFVGHLMTMLQAGRCIGSYYDNAFVGPHVTIVSGAWEHFPKPLGRESHAVGKSFPTAWEKYQCR